MKTLLIGGARSGKSSLAALWANERSNDVCCVVTATASDPEMSARIEAHRRERPAHWRIREEAVRLAPIVADHAAQRRAKGAANAPLLLIDCLTLWTANCLWSPDSTGKAPADAAGWVADLARWRAERDDLLVAVRDFRGEMILVSNEVGTGIVPENAAARLFRDEQGWLNQAVAAECDEVFLVAAGLPLRMKPNQC